MDGSPRSVLPGVDVGDGASGEVNRRRGTRGTLLREVQRALASSSPLTRDSEYTRGSEYEEGEEEGDGGNDRGKREESGEHRVSEEDENDDEDENDGSVKYDMISAIRISTDADDDDGRSAARSSSTASSASSSSTASSFKESVLETVCGDDTAYKYDEIDSTCALYGPRDESAAGYAGGKNTSAICGGGGGREGRDC